MWWQMGSKSFSRLVQGLLRGFTKEFGSSLVKCPVRKIWAIWAIFSVTGQFTAEKVRNAINLRLPEYGFRYIRGVVRTIPLRLLRKLKKKLGHFDLATQPARPCRNVSAYRRSRVLLSATFTVASVSGDCIVILWIQFKSMFFVVERLSFALWVYIDRLYNNGGCDDCFGSVVAIHRDDVRKWNWICFNLICKRLNAPQGVFCFLVG